MTLGNLIEFPNLEVLHLYRFGKQMASYPDESFEEHREYMIIWQRYMPNLREVALSSDVVWMRTRGPKPGWSREIVKAMEGTVGLIAYNHHT